MEPTDLNENQDLAEIEKKLTPEDYSTIRMVKAHAKEKGVTAIEALDDLLVRGLLDVTRVGIAVLVYLAATSLGVVSVIATVGSVLALHKLRERVSPKKEGLEEEVEKLRKLRSRLKKVPTKKGGDEIVPVLMPEGARA